MDDLNNCFGLNSLFAWMFYFVYTILYLVTLSEYLRSQIHTVDSTLELMQQSIVIVILLLIMIYSGFIGSALTDEVPRSYNRFHEVDRKILNLR